MKRFDLTFGTFGAVALVTLALCGCSSSNDNSQTTPTTPSSPDAASAEDAPGLELDGALDSPAASDAPVMSDGSCGGTSMKATAREADVLLVLDKSGSMLQTPSGFSAKKWDAMKTALRDALTPVKSKLSLGLEMFPYDPGGISASCSGNCCAMPTGGAAINVNIAPGDTSLDAILSAVDSTSPGGATPTAVALDQALAYFTTGAGKALTGDKFVLLATDGGPNCNTALTCDAATCTTNMDGNCSSGGNCCDPSITKISCLDDAQVTAKITALAGAGVKTVVVGIPGSEAYKSYLDAFAVAGGMPATSGTTKYYAVDGSDGVSGLTSTFSLITGELINSCKITLESTPPDPAQVNVYVDGTIVPQSGADGWDIDTSTTPPTITLKGRTCDTITTKGAKSINVTFGCPTIK